ncbi:MAG: endonuclease [Bacteroidales bacterium]|nr:endonuclease [Bacteroidales bacterium]
MNKIVFSFVVWAWGFGLMWAGAPAGYYDQARGKNKGELLTALFNIIGSHTNVGYSGVWTAYKTTDTEADGVTIIDMYSTAKFTYGTDQAGNFSQVGDKYNREHSFPNSWFGGSSSSAMYSDLFHVYPTDGMVNGQRANYIYGVCEGGTRLTNAAKGIVAKGRLGYSTYTYNGTSPYSDKVFEPDDEYKGDFARTYFYMATCYNDKIGSWSQSYSSTYVDDIVNNNRYPVYKDWYVAMLLEWHRLDPVSEKEIKRNDAVYALQRNRNPYIDHPELVEHVWGNLKDTGWGETAPVPEITSPQSGSQIYLGEAMVGTALTKTITVKGTDLTSALAVSISGTGFSADKTTIAAADANAGTTLTITYTGAVAGDATGSLSISSGEVSTTVSLLATATAVPDPEPELGQSTALDAERVGFTSFTARWTEGANAVAYNLYVNQKSQSTDPAVSLGQWNLGSGVPSGWGADKTYTDVAGYVRLGSAKAVGYVTTTALDPASGKVTVKVTAKYYSNDTDTQMKVSMLDASGGEVAAETMTITSADQEYTVLFTGAPSGCKVKIASVVNGKRVLLKALEIFDGDATAAQQAPRMAQQGDASARTITGITATHYTVEGLAEAGAYTYHVKPVGSDGMEGDASNTIEVALSPKPEPKLAATVVAQASAGEKVAVADADLLCVFVSADGRTIYAKDSGGYAEKDAIAEGETDFIAMHTPFMNGNAYDQSNWVAIALPASVEADDYVGCRLRDVEGEIVDLRNPQLSAFRLPAASTVQGYQNNVYIAANFGGTQTSNAGNRYFFISPKACEIATIRWAMYTADDIFTTPTSTGASNPEGLTGAFAADFSLLDAPFEFLPDNVYRFDALITKAAPSASGVKQAAQGEEAYVVYPLCNCEWEGSVVGGIVTGVSDASASREVKNVRYVNATGAVSAQPFSGLNIVITTYADGSRAVAKQVW